MSSINDFALEFNLQFSSKLKEICSPILTDFGAKGLCYLRFFHNGKIFRMGTITEWTRLYFEDLLYNSKLGDYRQILKINENKDFIVFQTGNPIDKYSKILFKLGIWNSCGIYRKLFDSVEVLYVAGSSSDFSVLELFFNKMDFINYILILVKSEAKSFYLNDKYFIKGSIIIDDIIDKNNINTNQLNFSKINIYPINTQSGDIFLSRREYQTLQILSEGKTAKEIALSLNISPRTVETYVNTLKIKIGCYTKTDLTKVFKKTGIKSDYLVRE